MKFVKIPVQEIEWLLNCSDSQMGDGDTARELAKAWRNGKSALKTINKQRKRLGEPPLKP